MKNKNGFIIFLTIAILTVVSLSIYNHFISDTSKEIKKELLRLKEYSLNEIEKNFDEFDYNYIKNEVNFIYSNINYAGIC